MRILYDHQAFSLQNAGGITRYFYELIQRFGSADGMEPEALLGYSDTIWPLREAVKPHGTLVHWGSRVFAGGMSTYALNELLLNAVSAASGRFDIYHNTLYRFMPGVRARRYVATHHDCVQERFPELFADYRRIMRTKRRMLRQADLVFCVSESSRNDLEHFYGVERSRCQIVYNGITPLPRSEAGAKQLAEQVKRPFLLYVGGRASYKNFGGLLSAFAKAQLGINYDLLVLGGGRFTTEELRLIREAGLEGKVVAWPLAGADLLAEAYAHARLLVYPSFYEGFGFPPLEAMSVGTPALVAASPATLEVCGDAALFFDPAQPEDFVVQLRVASSDETIRADMITRGYKLVQRYRWDLTAEQVMLGYKSLS
jgi:glycosyltransferase involved in cell wall biosynthesis